MATKNAGEYNQLSPLLIHQITAEAERQRASEEMDRKVNWAPWPGSHWLAFKVGIPF